MLAGQTSQILYFAMFRLEVIEVPGNPIVGAAFFWVNPMLGFDTSQGQNFKRMHKWNAKKNVATV